LRKVFITHLFSDNEKLGVFKNTFYLLVSQGINYLIPLIQTPLLFRLLSVEKIGMLNIVQSYAQYFIVLIDFGFNYSATKEVSVKRHDTIALNVIFSSVLYIKLLMGVLSLLIYLPTVLAITDSNQSSTFYSIYFLVVFSSVFNTTWFLQGVQEMKIFTLISSLSKALILFFLILSVNGDQDFLVISVIYGVVFFTTGLFTFWYTIRYSQLVKTLSDGSLIFFGNMAALLYTYSNIFLLGQMTSEIAVGIYSTADKIMKIGQTFFASFSIALFPYMSVRLLKEKNSRDVIRRLVMFSSSIMGLFSLTIFMGAESLIELFTGNLHSEMILCLKILSPVPMIVMLSSIFGIQVMLNKGYTKQYFFILLFAAVLNFVITPILIDRFQYIGLSIGTIIIESTVTSSMFLFLRTKRII
jgi:PST family polysaccharide transporter